MQNYISALRKQGIFPLCHHCLQITDPRTWPPAGLPWGGHWTAWRPQRGSRPWQEVQPQGGRVQTTRKSTLPQTAGLLPDTRQHHLHLLAPGSAPVVSQQLGKHLWSWQHCTEGYLIICNGFSIPVIISSPESRERDRDSAGKQAASTCFGEAFGFAV